MPVISALTLTNQRPGVTYTASVLTSASLVSGLAGNLLADGAGNQITLLAVTTSYAHTASIQTSWEESSSYASASSTASYALDVSNVVSYVTITTSSTNWVTCSFRQPNQSVVFASGAAYSFTASNMPANGQVADVILHISQSSTSTSSLSFPASWVNLGTGWPTQITSSKMAILWLRAMDARMVMGTYNVQS